MLVNKEISKDCRISIIPHSKDYLHTGSLPNLVEFVTDRRSIAQKKKTLGKMLWLEGFFKVINPSPKFLGS